MPVLFGDFSQWTDIEVAGSHGIKMQNSEKSERLRKANSLCGIQLLILVPLILYIALRRIQKTELMFQLARMEYIGWYRSKLVNISILMCVYAVIYSESSWRPSINRHLEYKLSEIILALSMINFMYIGTYKNN